ncbi:MAG: hypothetical protein AAGJ52_13735, partial [Pseudomonadota bacterium]
AGLSLNNPLTLLIEKLWVLCAFASAQREMELRFANGKKRFHFERPRVREALDRPANSHQG